MMAVEYAPRGLLGVLTPQANTTVEPEFAALLPPGVGMLNARMTSGKGTIVARLLDYLASLDAWSGQFANAPVGAVAFACTGASYYAGVAEEMAAVTRISAARGVPFVTAGHAVRDAFHALGARRIGLVSPYPADLTEAAVAYFTALGFEVARVSGSEQRDGVFHPIYAMTSEGAHAALTALDPEGCEAIAMLGTGMPTLGPILRTPFHRGVPVLSCMLALAWRSMAALDGVAPSRDGLLAWVRGEGWGPRHQARMAVAGGGGLPL
jgi:maleate cis-trans isomerase